MTEPKTASCNSPAALSMPRVNSILVWPFALIGVGTAFLLEWRYARVVRRGS
jgi:hypothetical protein